MKVLLMAMIILVSVVTVVPETHAFDDSGIIVPCGDEDLPVG